MNVLEYTLGLPPYRRGGLTKYSVSFAKYLCSDVDNVYFMYPGRMNLLFKNSLGYKILNSKMPFKVIEMYNPLPVSLGLGISDEKIYMEKRDVTKIISLLNELKIDILHLHTLMGLSLELLQEVKKAGIRIVYTTHDMYGLCTKMLHQDPCEELKTSKCTYDCMLCKNGPSKKKLWVMQTHLYANLKESKIVKKVRMNEKKELNTKRDEAEQFFSQDRVKNRYALRKYYLQMFGLIDKFHFNSSVSKEYFEKMLGNNIDGKVINIMHPTIKDERFKHKKKENSNLILGYVGPYDEKKGFFLYKEVLTKLRSKHTKFEAYFCGDISLDQFFDENGWVRNYGLVSEEKLNSLYEKFDILVVPSLWHETFGFVVLEAIAHGIPCIVSANVGAKDILKNSDFIFSTGKQGLYDELDHILSKPEKIANLKNKVLNLDIQLNFAEHVKQVKNELFL